MAMMGEKATPGPMRCFSGTLWFERQCFRSIWALYGELVQGDFGDSIQYHRPVTDYLSERLPMTFELTIGAMIFSTFFGILLGLSPPYAAIRSLIL